jgi:hypothetical protein
MNISASFFQGRAEIEEVESPAERGGGGEGEVGGGVGGQQPSRLSSFSRWFAHLARFSPFALLSNVVRQLGIYSVCDHCGASDGNTLCV